MDGRLQLEIFLAYFPRFFFLLLGEAFVDLVLVHYVPSRKAVVPEILKG
jgi:hypothetical protein